jgi:hypothetical protein
MEAKPFTVNSLLYEIEKLEVKPQDILILAFFGHGNSSDVVSDNFPKIFMGIDDSESIKISTLKEKVKAKKARICITYVGACSGNNKENRSTINYTERQSLKGVNTDRLRPLFLGIRGEIVICSSKKKFVSWSYKDGGISFTYILNNLIKMSRGETRDISWHHLLNITCNELSSHFGSTPYYQINLNNDIKVIPHTETNSSILEEDKISRINKSIRFKTNLKNQLYAENLTDKAVLVKIVYYNEKKQLNSSRTVRIFPRKKVYLRNENFSFIEPHKNNFYVFFKKLNRGDPFYKVTWDNGNKINVNGKKEPLEIMSFEMDE